MPKRKFVDVGRATLMDASPPDPDNPPKLPDDAYPDVILDARHGYAKETREEIREYQRGWLVGEVPPHGPPGAPPNWPVRVPTPDPEKRTVVPYINASRWIADCPQCGTSNWMFDQLPDMVCLGRGCGLVFKAEWQLPQDRSAVIRLLAGWPEGNSNWDAHKDETLEELKLQQILLLGVPAVERNGLVMAANIDLPDDLTDPNEYLDRLKTQRRKAQLGRGR
jgi:hypothetical protein